MNSKAQKMFRKCHFPLLLLLHLGTTDLLTDDNVLEAKVEVEVETEVDAEAEAEAVASIFTIAGFPVETLNRITIVVEVASVMKKATVVGDDQTTMIDLLHLDSLLHAPSGLMA